MKDQFWLWFAAFAGVLARFGQWWETDEKFLWRKAISEVLTVPAIVYITVGAAEYWSPNTDIKIVSALAALIGVLGTATIQSIAPDWIRKKLGGL